MRKFIHIIIAMVIFASMFCSITVSAKEPEPQGSKIFAVSRGGDTSEFPENSLEAIEACFSLNIDAVSVPVKETADGRIIVFGSDNTAGLCVDKNSAQTNKNISETDYKTLSSFYLLSMEGGNLSVATKSAVPLLEDVVKLTDGKVQLIIDCNKDILDKTYNTVKKYGSVKNVIFRCKDVKNKDMMSWSESKEDKPQFIASYKGNIIFSAISQYNFAEKNKVSIIEFSTKNQYGVIYSDFFTNRFDNVQALAPVYDPDLCGMRSDSVTGWEDLISRGFTAIETEKAREFSQYISLVEETSSRLENFYNQIKDADLSAYSSSGVKKFNKHLKNAEEIIVSEKAYSATQISNCFDNLKTASRELIKADGDNTNDASVSPMKIFWIILAIALFVSSQVYLHKKTK